MGVLGADHTVRWWKRTPFTDVLLRLPGIGDVRRDGSRCLGIGHSDGTFVCYDGATGREVWTLPLDAVTTDIVTCDIDGDGRDEFITGTTDGRLIALGAGAAGQGRIVWSIDLGFATGSPVVADADGDGLPEILVVAGDGFLTASGNQSGGGNPEIPRIYGFKGAEVVFWPTVSHGPTQEGLRTQLMARAIDNALVMVESNLASHPPYAPYVGRYRPDTARIGPLPGI